MQNIFTDNLIDNAFGLGISGFMLLIVLILVTIVVFKLLGVFVKVPDKLDRMTSELAKNNKELTMEVAKSNKELSNQLIKSSVVQESMLGVMKEIMMSINYNNSKMAVIETQMERNAAAIDEVSRRTSEALSDIKEINSKIDKVLE